MVRWMTACFRRELRGVLELGQPVGEITLSQEQEAEVVARVNMVGGKPQRLTVGFRGLHPCTAPT